MSFAMGFAAGFVFGACLIAEVLRWLGSREPHD